MAVTLEDFYDPDTEHYDADAAGDSLAQTMCKVFAAIDDRFVVALIARPRTASNDSITLATPGASRPRRRCTLFFLERTKAARVSNRRFRNTVARILRTSRQLSYSLVLNKLRGGSRRLLTSTSRETAQNTTQQPTP